jgi:hypothetical protein
MRSSSTLAPTVTEKCPAWCTDHRNFTDGSDDWHDSRTVEIHGFMLYISTGTTTGQPELFIPQHGAHDGLTLRQAAEVAHAMLTLVKAVSA